MAAAAEQKEDPPAPCCPAGSLPYLSSSYEPTGTIETVSIPGGGTLELYCPPAPAGDCSGKAILALPDVWGWNGGRMRAIADSLAKEGYAVAVPKLLTPASNGGTDGDALSPTCEFSMDCTVCSPACFEPLFTSPVSV